MNKKLSVLFIFLLFFQTITSGFALPGQAIAQGDTERIMNDVTLKDADGNKISVDDAEAGTKVNIHIDWSTAGVDLNKINSDSIPVPKGLKVQEEQKGALLSDNLEAGAYHASADGMITVQFEEAEGLEETSGNFDIRAFVEEKESAEEKTPKTGADHSSEKELDGEDETTKEAEPKEDGESKGQSAEGADIDKATNSAQMKPASFNNAMLFTAGEISENIITGVTLSQRFEDGTQELTPGEDIELSRPFDDFKVTIDYDFALPNNHGYSAGSTYTINVPEQFKVQANPEPIELRTSNGNVVFGTFTSNSNNQIIIEFNEEIEGNSKISGFIKLESAFDKHYSKGSAEQEITFPVSDGSEVTYPVKFTPSASSISKEAEKDQPYNTKEITWTVDFNKDLQELTGAQLQDTLSSGHNYTSDPIEVYELEMNIDGTIASATRIADNHFGSNFPLTLGDIDKAYRIVYKTKIDEDDDGKTYNNNVSLNADELSSPLDAQASVNVKRGEPLEKTNGKYDKAEQTVEWIVKYNYDEKSIDQSKAILTDELEGNHALVDDSFEVNRITINQQTGEESSRDPVSQGTNPEDYTVAPNSDGKGFTLQFNEAIDSAYEIRYTTKAVDRPGEGSTGNSNEIKNSISDEFGHNKPASTTISQQIFFKSHSGIDYENKKVSWNITMNKDKQTMKNVIFNDTLPTGFTVDGNNNGIKVIHGGNEWTEGTDYTLTYDETTGKINIVFSNEITDVVKINYTTTFDYDDIITDQGEDRKQNHKNEARVDWEVEHTPGSTTTGEQEADSTFTPDDYTKQNGFKNGTYNPVSKEIDWEIGVNYNKEILENAVVEDVIQGNQNFDISSVKVYEMELTGNKNGVTKGDPLPEGSYTVERILDGFKVNLGEIKEPYLIEYKTDLQGLLVNSSYDNTATVKSDNKNAFDLRAKVTPYEGGKYTGKHGEQNNANPRIVNWSVDINRSQSKLNDVEITDTLSKNQTIRKDSVVLYGTKVSTNPNSIVKDESNVLKEGTDYTIAFEENADGSESFTIAFKNSIEEAYVLEYDSYILYKGNGDEADFKNNFTLNGEGTESVSSSDPFSKAIDISNISGGITGEVGALIVTKVDADNPTAPLEGATFELYDNEDNFIRSGTTNEEGKITFKNLLYDKDYKLKETDAPEGYVVGINDQKEITFSKENDEVIIENKPIKRDVELTKVDSDDNSIKLENAGFELQQKDGNGDYQSKGFYRTNSNGVIHLSDLTPGDYRFVEVTAPNGYQLTEEVYEFTIEVKQTEIDTITAENYKLGSVQLTKVDAETGDKIEGATFNLQKEESNGDFTSIGSNTTDENGLIEVGGLEPGNYRFVETNPASGYQLGTEKIDFSIVEKETKTITVDAKNYKLASVELIKFNEDDHSEILKGAEFKLVDEKGKVIKQLLRTNDDGKIIVPELKPGKYKFIETKAPDYFQLNDTPLEFEMESGKTDTVTVEAANQLINGEVRLTKVDQDDETPLANAEFKLVNENGGVVKEDLMTNEDGQISVTDLKPGKYTFIETKAPEHYQLKNKEYDFTIERSKTEDDVETVKVQAENELKPGFVELVKVDKDDNEKALEGAEFTLQDADENVIKENLKTNADGKVMVDHLRPGKYYFIETKAPDFYQKLNGKIEVTIEKSQSETLQVTVENELIRGSVELSKVDVDNNNNPLEDAVFELQDSEDKKLQGDLTTNQDGKLIVDDLKPGDYQFVETEAPFGYVLDQTPIEFTIEKAKTESDVKTVQVTAENELSTGSVELTKTDQDNNDAPLANVVFELQNAEGIKLKEDLKTNQDGKLIVNDLKPGIYQFVETKAPFGYDLDPTPVEFEIDKGQEEIKTVSKSNELTTGSVELVKVDKDNNEIALEGAEFELQDDEGNTLQEGLSTNKDGKLLVDGLKPGDYQFVEMKAPFGYDKDTTPISFTIAKGQVETVVKVMENVISTGSVELIKVDQDNNELTLEGAEFELQDVDGKTLQKGLTTNEDGALSVDELKPGTYQFVETKAPKHYQLDNTPIVFTIEKGQEITLTVQALNELIPGSVELLKVDQDNKDITLEGAEFELQDSEGNMHQRELTTGKDGTVIVDNLKPGAYQLIETKAPFGYDLDPTAVTFEIEKSQDEILTVTKTNKLSTGAVELVKVDQDNNEIMLEGAEFELLDAEGNTLQEGLTTNEDGKIIVTDLHPGDYQFVETKAPVGYELDNSPVGFTIKKGQEQSENVMVENIQQQQPEQGTGTLEDENDPGENGSTLPKTATNMYNLFLIGSLLLMAGLIVLYVRRKSSRSEE